MSASAQNARVTNLTLEDINSKVVDTVNNSSEVMRRTVANPTRWNGRQKQYPIFTNNSTLGQSFKNTETFDTTIDMNTQQFVFYPTGYAQPVGVSIVERSMNNTPAGVIDLYKTSYGYAQNSMITNLANIFYGYGNGNDFDGFGNIIDNGTNSTSYGGVSRTTFPTINAYLAAASAGVLDLATMAAADDGATISGDDQETPNVIMTNQTVWSLYDSLLEPSARSDYSALGPEFYNGNTAIKQSPTASNAFTLRAGANSVSYRGKPLVRDQKAPAGNMYFINEKYWEFCSLPLYGLQIVATTTDSDGVEGAYDNIKVSSIQFRQPMQPYNQLAEVGIFVMYGQLICRNPNRNSLITGLTTT
jgi:hypothetical protein